MDAKIKYLLFDVAGTLLHKPTLFEALVKVLKKHGYHIEKSEVKLKHKLITEIIHFPDKTSESFYKKFNSELLYSLGILPNELLLEEVFKACSYLPWEKYEDTSVLNEIALPMGILSNFNSSLHEKLNCFFGPIFQHVIVSEEVGVAKPSLDFYAKAIERISVSPENILYIGDSLKLDIDPAIALGMKTVLIDRDTNFPNSKCAITDLYQILNYV
jgi:FMN phosphatase YigB (HAD superfamily)